MLSAASIKQAQTNHEVKLGLKAVKQPAMKIDKKQIQLKAPAKPAPPTNASREPSKPLENKEETIQMEISDYQSEENYEPTIEATLDLSAK